MIHKSNLNSYTIITHNKHTHIHPYKVLKTIFLLFILCWVFDSSKCDVMEEDLVNTYGMLCTWTSFQRISTNIFVYLCIFCSVIPFQITDFSFVFYLLSHPHASPLFCAGFCALLCLILTFKKLLISFLSYIHSTFGVFF